MSPLAAAMAAGFTLGVAVAAPIGPVGAATIREGLERGTRSAFLLGLGAASVDFVYLGLVFLGVAPLLLRLPFLIPAFYAGGALLLLYLAWGALQSGLRPTPATAPGANHRPRTGGGRTYLYGVGLTLLNPATILSWLGLGGAFASRWAPALTGTGMVGVLFAVFAGSAGWFALLALMAGSARHLAERNPLVLRVVNLVAAAVLLVFALTFLMRAWQG